MQQLEQQRALGQLLTESVESFFLRILQHRLLLDYWTQPMFCAGLLAVPVALIALTMLPFALIAFPAQQMQVVIKLFVTLLQHY